MRAVVFLFVFLIVIHFCESQNTTGVNRQKRQASCGYSVKKAGLIFGGNYFKKGDYPW
jgi:hypothetical protein